MRGGILVRVVWLAALLCCSAAAQHWKFRNFGLEEGLTNFNVGDIHQDRQGFLWVATEGGLFRYDGDRFLQFPVEAGKRRGVVYSLHSSGDGQLWAASTAGLFRFDGARFQPSPDFTGLDADSGQALASDAANLYIATSAGLQALPLGRAGAARLLSPKPSRSVTVTRDGTVWFGCGGRLCRVREGREEEVAGTEGGSGGSWLSIVEDRQGRIWVRSKERLLVRDRPHASFAPVAGLEACRSAGRARLATDRHGQVLVPHAGGLGVCGGAGCRTYAAESGLRPAEVYSAHEDREGTLWIGYSGQGLDQRLGRGRWVAFSENEGLTNAGIWRLARSPDGTLWVGTNGGLYRGSEEGGRWVFRHEEVLKNQTIYALAADPDASVWVATFQTALNGLLRYDPATRAQKLYTLPLQGVRFGANQLRRDASGAVWLCTNLGLFRLPPGGGRLERVPLPSDPGSVQDVAVTPEGLFVCTKKGLYVETPGMHRMLTMADGLKENLVESLARAPDGSIWVAYLTPVGITRLTLKGTTVGMQHFGANSGLPSDTVYSQMFDSAGRHWIGTGSGAAVQDRGRWINYDASDGLIWNDCNAGAMLAGPEGTMWIGTSAGLARFSPAPAPRRVPVEARITSVLRNERAVEDTRFGPDTRSVTLRFTVLAFERRNVLFRYRLGSGSDPWTETKSREVRFAELPPGKYRFEVQGQLESGEWSLPGSVGFRIEPPWYGSLTYQVAFLALVVGAAFLWLRNRAKQQKAIRANLERAVELRTRELAEAHDKLELRVEERTRELRKEIAERERAERDLLEAKQAAEASNRAKGTFLANMGHEFRTPLNAILGYTEMLREDLAGGDARASLNDLDRIHLAGRHLVEIVEDVLELTRLEAGSSEVNLDRLRVASLAEDLGRVAQGMAGNNRFTIVNRCPEDYVLADEVKFRRSLVNLLSNACKFTDNGEVVLSVERRLCAEREWICWEVRDTGIGIAEADLPKLFQSFSQVDSSSTRRHDGTGLGLAVSDRLCRIMGAHITVESRLGAGSRFTVHTPVWHGTESGHSVTLTAG